MTAPRKPRPCPDRFAVEIGLYRCGFDGKLFLCFDHKDGSGHRISGHKPVTSSLVESFRCEFTLVDLEETSAVADAPRPAPESGECSVCGHDEPAAIHHEAVVRGMHRFYPSPPSPAPASDTDERGRMSDEEFERRYGPRQMHEDPLLGEARRARESEGIKIGHITALLEQRDEKDAQIAALKKRIAELEKK